VELEWVFGDLHGVAGKRVLELGPGRREDLLELLLHFKAEASAVGMSTPRWWNRKRQLVSPRIRSAYIYPFLTSEPSESYDLIISRHVLEQYSLDAGLLLKDPAFKEAIRSNSFKDLPESFPASQKNLLAIFMACYRVLKPGGVLITQVAKKKVAILTEAGLQEFRPSKFRFRSLGRLSEISTFVKQL